MIWLHRFSIRRPKTAVILGLAVTAIVAPGIARLELRTDGHALVPQDAPEIEIDRAVRRLYDVRDLIVVVVHAPPGQTIFNSATLHAVAELTSALQQLDPIEPDKVMSLATEHGDRVKTGTLQFRTLLDPMPETATDFHRLQNDLREIDLYTGTLLADDETAAAILVGVPQHIDRVELYRRIETLADGYRTDATTIDVIGAPVAEALLGLHLLDDLGVPDVALGGRLAAAESWDEADQPRTFDEYRLWIAHRVGLVPIALVVMALVFWISFRSLTAAILPLIEVGACLAFVFGLMGYFAVPIYLTIAVMPVILTVVGVADELHIFTRYRQVLRRGKIERRAAVTTTLDEMWRPVVKTSVTTAVGFCSFALSPIQPVQAFGVFTAVGVIFCMLWSLTVIPASLTLIPTRLFFKQVRRAPTDPDAGPVPAALQRSVFTRIAGFSVRGRRAIVLLAVVLLAVAPFGVSRLVIQDSWIDGFARESRFHKATTDFNRHFLGTHLLLLDVQADARVTRCDVDAQSITTNELSVPATVTDDPQSLIGQWLTLDAAGDGAQPDGAARARRLREYCIEDARLEGGKIVIKTDRASGSLFISLRGQNAETVRCKLKPLPLADPGQLETIASLERFIADHSLEAVGGVHGPGRYMATTNFMSKARRRSERRIPDDPHLVRRDWDHYARVRGQTRRSELVNDTFSSGLITVFLKDANFQDTQRLIHDIRAYEASELAPKGMSIRFAGDVAVSQTLIGAIVTTQVRSLLASVAGIILVTALLARSPVWGLLSALPCALAVLLNFALMGAIGMPLGVATSMFAGMTLGIGIDYAIHLLEDYRIHRAAGCERTTAVFAASNIAGPAIVIDAAGVALGFGVMTLSQVPANARLGLLLVTSTAFCLAATMLLLPAVLTLGRSGSPTGQSV